MDIKSAFEEFAGGESHMTGEQLRRFVREHQDEKEPDAGFDLELLHLFKITCPFLSLEDFQYFLFSDEFNPPISTQVHHDMTAPLSHYYIYTGHNSYLTGNQLSSGSSDVPIIKALQRGVRVIELDMWPNSKRDDINILHGRTLTAPVKLIKCLTSIKEHAFSASPYPLVLTLEDHLTPDLQAKVAQMVIEMFGDILYYPKSEWLEEFPSPEELKNRIILSTNPPKKDLESKSSTDKDNGSYTESKSSTDKDNGSYPESKSSTDKDDGSYPESKSSNDKDDGSYPESKNSNPESKSSNPESKSSNDKEDGSCPESKSSNNKEDGSCPESRSSNDKEDGSYPQSKTSNDEDGSPKEKESSDEEVWEGEVKNLQSLLGRNESRYDRNELDEDEEDAEDDLNSRQKSAPEYTCLITVRAGKPKDGLRKALQVDPDKARRLSLSEQELERAAAYYGSDLIK